MDPATIALLTLAAMVGGGLNAVAGGGSFFTFPALLFAGVPPVQANATSATALWPASVASAGAYRDDLKHARKVTLTLGAASLVGGLLGAWLLLGTPQETFRRLVPWLLLAATLVFALAPRLLARLRRKPAHEHLASSTELALLGLGWLVIATYGGYFGGGMGLMMLATLALAGMTDIHAMNGLKVVMGATLNGVAIVAFAWAGVVEWPYALVMLAGSIAGGFFGAKLAKRVKADRVRTFVVMVGATLTAYFFWATS